MSLGAAFCVTISCSAWRRSWRRSANRTALCFCWMSCSDSWRLWCSWIDGVTIHRLQNQSSQANLGFQPSYRPKLSGSWPAPIPSKTWGRARSIVRYSHGTRKYVVTFLLDLWHFSRLIAFWRLLNFARLRPIPNPFDTLLLCHLHHQKLQLLPFRLWTKLGSLFFGWHCRTACAARFQTRWFGA